MSNKRKTSPVPSIVLVEDEPDILIILHRLMRDLTGTYSIVTVNGAAEALAQIALRPVPLVLPVTRGCSNGR